MLPHSGGFDPLRLPRGAGLNVGAMSAEGSSNGSGSSRDPAGGGNNGGSLSALPGGAVDVYTPAASVASLRGDALRASQAAGRDDDDDNELELSYDVTRDTAEQEKGNGLRALAGAAEPMNSVQTAQQVAEAPQDAWGHVGGRANQRSWSAGVIRDGGRGQRELAQVQAWTGASGGGGGGAGSRGGNLRWGGTRPSSAMTNR